MDLTQIRQLLDKIDNEITELFIKRMTLVADVAEYKRKNNIPILNKSREDEIIERVTTGKDRELTEYIRLLFSTMFELSRTFQALKLKDDKNTAFAEALIKATENSPTEFPSRARVACQGIEGANSETAARCLFAEPQISFYKSFADVFEAVEKGEQRFGILPVENSLQGPVTAVYDLLKKHSVSIVKSVKLKIDHVLLSQPGAKLGDIREIYSHEQALAQCSEFLSELNDVRLIPCENTAIAARLVRDSKALNKAAIAAPKCSQLYSLSMLCDNIHNNSNNYTRFICISKEMMIYPGADKITLMFTVPNRSGALYGIISMLAAIGVNMTKIESRPIPGTDFEFLFYIDIDGSLADKKLLGLILMLNSELEYFNFAGNYSELCLQ